MRLLSFEASSGLRGMAVVHCTMGRVTEGGLAVILICGGLKRATTSAQLIFQGVQSASAGGW